MKAVMYGAGTIGRGFIGMLFSASGYEVTFVDVARPVIEALNRDKKYPVRIVSNEGHEDLDVLHVRAIDGNDQAAVAAAIGEADIMATAVGVNILKFIIPNLVAGIRRRMAESGRPLNIIICENLMDANKVVEKMLKEELTEEEICWFDKNIGLVEASIGRMVPVQTEEMKDGNPLRVCVERYGFLPVDKAAFKGDIPEIGNMIPFEPFDFYIKRKLYIHNMGHATCAYLGMFSGKDYIFESIADADTQGIVQNAMLESSLALSKKYEIPMEQLMCHVQDLLFRFTNRALKDTCKRVGGDPRRKLSPADRMIGSSLLCLEEEITPAFISVGTAGAVYAYIREQGLPQSLENAKETLRTISGLEDGHPLYTWILPYYEMYRQGTGIRELRLAAEDARSRELKEVI